MLTLVTSMWKTLFSTATIVALVVAAPPCVRAQEVADPLESINRGIFWFNDAVDVNVLEPVAIAWRDNLPHVLTSSVHNFFDNFLTPSRMVSQLLRLNVTQAGVETARFFVNSTVGILGINDVATVWGLEKKKADTALIFANYGVPSGPYLVLPFLGPSTVRETVGLVGDFFLDPMYWIGKSIDNTSTMYAITVPAAALRIVDIRAQLLDATDAGKDSATDYYLFSQGAFMQYREGLLKDENDDPFADEKAEEAEYQTLQTE